MPRAPKAGSGPDDQAFPAEGFVRSAITSWAQARGSVCSVLAGSVLDMRDAKTGLQAIVFVVGVDVHDAVSLLRPMPAVAFASARPYETVAVAAPELPVFRHAASLPSVVPGGRRNLWWLFVRPDGSVAEVPPPPEQRAAASRTFRLRADQSSTRSGLTA